MEGSRGNAGQKRADIAAKAKPRTNAHQNAAKGSAEKLTRVRPVLTTQSASRGRHRASPEDHPDIHEAADIRQHRMLQRPARSRPLPEGKAVNRHAKRGGDLRAPQGKAECHAPGMARNREYKPAQNRNHQRREDQLARHRFAAPSSKVVKHPAHQRDQTQIRDDANRRTGAAGNRHLAKRTDMDDRGKKKGAEKRPQNEEGKRHQHAARPAPEAEQNAGPAAIGELHANPEQKGPDDKRHRNRGHGSSRTQADQPGRQNHQRDKPDQQEV